LREMATKSAIITLITFTAAAFLLLWYPQVARCSESSKGTKGSEGSEGHFGSFDVNIMGRGYVYFQPNPRAEGEKDVFGETKVNLTYSNTFHNSLFFKLSTRFQIDTDHKSEGAIDSFKDNEQQRRILDVNEAFIEHRLGIFDYFIGKRILSWGKGDNFNLSDKINPKDYTDFLDNEKTGVLLAGLKLYPTGNSQLEACIMPLFTRSRVSLADGRWAPCCNSQVHIEEDIPSDTMQYASRYSLYLENLDIDLTYMRKTEDLPTLMASPITQLIVGPPTLVEKYRKMNLFSLEGTTTLADEFEFHAGAAYHDIDQEQLYGQFIQYMAGINYTFDKRVLFSKSIKLVGEYLGYIDVDKPENKKLIVLDFVRIFENSLFLKVTSTVTDFSDFQIGNLFSLEKSFNDILRVEYKYSPSDKVELKVGSDFIWGDGEMIFDQFDKNDRIWASIKYLF
jgi:hypothetical protein